MAQKVLVTGATGFIGIEVSRQLTERGMRPRLMVRRPVRGLMLRNLEAEIMQADIRSPESLDRILKGTDTVIHLGARAAFEPYPRLYPSIVKGSMNLMQAAIKAGVKNFVFGGSLLVYGDTDKPIGQNTGASPMSGYGKAKLEAEQHLEEMAAKAGICFISLRLPHVYGARALISAAENCRPGIWVVADELSCTWNEYFETVQTYYPRLRVTHIPRTISYMGTRILDLFFGLTAQANPYPSGAISSWNLRLPVEPGTIRQTIGVEPKFATIHQGIPAVLDDSISFYWLPSNLDRL